MTELARRQRWWLNAWPHRWYIRYHIPRFLKSAPDPFRGEVLEVGAGRGWTSQQILETFPQVELTATDIDPVSTAHFSALQRTFGQRLKVQAAAIEALPFDRHAFDIVIAVHVLRHVADLPRAVQQLLRVLRPGGLLGVSDISSSLNPILPELRQLLSAEGCTISHSRGRHRFILWAQKKYPVTTV